MRLPCAKKYNFPLLPPPSDEEATAKSDEAQAVEMSYFAEPAGRLTFEKFVKTKLRLPPNDAVVAEALKSLEVFFDVAEKTLQQQDYMAGDKFTLVDIAYIPLVQRLYVIGHGDLLSRRKAVSSWWDRCVSRSAVSKWVQDG